MTAVEPAKLQSALRRDLLVLGTRGFERLDIAGGYDDEAGELELAVAREELCLAIANVRLCAVVTSSDAEPAPRSLLLVGREANRVTFDGSSGA